MAEILDIKYLIYDDPIFKEDISQCVNDFRNK